MIDLGKQWRGHKRVFLAAGVSIYRELAAAFNPIYVDISLIYHHDLLRATIVDKGDDLYLSMHANISKIPMSEWSEGDPTTSWW